MNALPSELIAIAALNVPGAKVAGASSSGYVDASRYGRLMAIIATGTLGASATLDAKLQMALVQIVKASGDSKTAVINLDTSSKVLTKRYVKLVLTVATATSDATGLLLGIDPKYAPASADNPAANVQIVSVQ
jgi:hypothetical protein